MKAWFGQHDRVCCNRARIGAGVACVVVILSCAITGAEAATVVVQVKDRNNAPVANAVVWAMPVGAMPPPAPPSTTRTLVIEQRMMKFEPYVSIVQTGTLLRLPNRDRIEHHVETLSGPNVFEYRLYLREPPEPVRLSKAGHTVLQCLVHDWMAAHIYTVDTPWFAKTHRDGSAIIESVPAGEYEIYLAHPNLALPTQVTPLFPRRVRLEATTAQLLDAKLDIVPRPEPSRRPVPEQYRD